VIQEKEQAEVPMDGRFENDRRVKEGVATLIEKAQELKKQVGQLPGAPPGVAKDEHALFLIALDLLLKNWGNKEVAQGVGVDFFLLPILAKLGAKESLILTLDGEELRLERTTEVVGTPGAKTDSCHLCVINGRLYCCPTP
jgi:hypothetical protein